MGAFRFAGRLGLVVHEFGSGASFGDSCRPVGRSSNTDRHGVETRKYNLFCRRLWLRAKVRLRNVRDRAIHGHLAFFKEDTSRAGAFEEFSGV